jgi:hypothetical protein
MAAATVKAAIIPSIVLRQSIFGSGHPSANLRREPSQALGLTGSACAFHCIAKPEFGDGSFRRASHPHTPIPAIVTAKLPLRNRHARGAPRHY